MRRSLDQRAGLRDAPQPRAKGVLGVVVRKAKMWKRRGKQVGIGDRKLMVCDSRE